MTAVNKKYSGCGPMVSKTFGLHLFVWLIGIVLLTGVTGCKPTEKNYRSAYDVAREKRERDEREKEERRREMGMEGVTIENADGVSAVTISGRRLLSRHLNFQRGDSVGDYAVSVATFRMPGNANAMAQDLRAQGLSAARALKASDQYFLIIGDSQEASEAIAIIDGFKNRYPEWQYVGQPDILLIIGGSR